MDKKKKIENIAQWSNKRIIIPSKEQSYTFENDTYREEFISQILSKSDYDSIINKASKLLSASWTKKRVNDQIKLPKSVIILVVLAIVFTILYMIFLYLSSSSENGTVMLIISIVSVSIGSAIAFGLSIYNFCRAISKFKTLDEIIKEDLDIYFVEVNKKYDGLLLFEFNSHKRWIECNINKMNERLVREEKKHYNISEQVEEEPENENKVEEEGRISKGFSKHSKHYSEAMHTNKIASKIHSRAVSYAFKRPEGTLETEMNLLPDKKEN